MSGVRDPRADAVGVCSNVHYQSWTSAGGTPSPARPRVESIAQLASRSSPKPEDLTGILLTSVLPMNNHGCEVLRPLWAEEAMHRAYTFIRLIEKRNRRGQWARENAITAAAGERAARDLVSWFRELATAGERAASPCSDVLSNVVANLGVLFGRPDNIDLETKFNDVSLPAYKRRALVLASCELVCNALLHAFQERETGVIEAGMTDRGPRSACLRVADNGAGFNGVSANLTCGVAAGLAGLLEADLTYHRTAGWTVAEIVFPVR